MCGLSRVFDTCTPASTSHWNNIRIYNISLPPHNVYDIPLWPYTSKVFQLLDVSETISATTETRCQQRGCASAYRVFRVSSRYPKIILCELQQLTPTFRSHFGYASTLALANGAWPQNDFRGENPNRKDNIPRLRHYIRLMIQRCLNALAENM